MSSQVGPTLGKCGLCGLLQNWRPPRFLGGQLRWLLVRVGGEGRDTCPGRAGVGPGGENSVVRHSEPWIQVSDGG